MSHVANEGTLLGVNMKKNGTMVLQIEIDEDLQSHEEYYFLRKMIQNKVRFSLESEVVKYTVQVDVRSEKPIRTFAVDSSGVVSEVKPDGEQVEMELGLPKNKASIKDIPEVISREIVDEYICNVAAPTSGEFRWHPVREWVMRLNDGETYLRIAREAGMSSGRLVELVDRYRALVAPLAAKWNEWRENNGPSEDFEIEDEPETEGDETEPVEGEDEEVDEQEPAPDQTEPQGTPAESRGPEPTKEEVDQYILLNKPIFDGIHFDPRFFIEKNESGLGWNEVAENHGLEWSKMEKAWRKYRLRVAEEIMNNGAA